MDAYIELGATVVTLLRLNGSPEVMEHAQMKQEARRRIEEIVEFEKTLSKVKGASQVGYVHCSRVLCYRVFCLNMDTTTMYCCRDPWLQSCKLTG